MPPALNLGIVNAIKEALGLPETVVGALPIVLKLTDYGGEAVGSWVLLEALE
jgi:hypothetical protein